MNKKHPTPPPAYFLSLSLENVRSFGEEQTISFTRDGIPAQWTVILGNNGVGKTTILKSLASIAPTTRKVGEDTLTNINHYSVRYASSYPWSALRHSGEKSAVISILCRTDVKLSTKKGFASKLFQSKLTVLSPQISRYTPYTDDLLGLICYGYGAGRSVGTTSLSDSKNSDTTALSLFDDKANLMNPEEWFLQFYINAKIQPDNIRATDYYDRVKQALLEVLPDIADLKIVSAGRPESPHQELQLQTPYGWVRLSEMSLGYQTLTVWLTDLASRLFERYPDSPNPLAEPAIVLVDEIDLHLHPEWQRKLINFLSDTFPNTQFIVTAHSPLVVQAASDAGANIVLLQREDDQVIVKNDMQSVRDWRIDQILTSDLFGLETARSLEYEEKLKRRAELQAKSRLTKSERVELEVLNAFVHQQPVGETATERRREDILEELARKLGK